MNRSLLRSIVLGRIQEAGRRLGAPTVTFAGRIISVPGEDIYVVRTLLRTIAMSSGFYLALPANAYGVVTFPDGTSLNMEGGLHEVPPGLYKMQYVDRHERLEFLSPISEMSTDGEKITLTVILRYRVLDPIVALRIDRPVETLVEHVEADVAQYIRTHDHTDIADSSENQQDSKLLSFFIQRHNRRLPLSRAFGLTGIEIKDFSGDGEYVEMRRRASMELRKNRIEKEQTVYQQELIQLKAQYKVEAEKMMAEHNAELMKKAAEHKANIEKIQARHEKEKQEILEQVELREIELDQKRQHLQMRREQFSQVIEAISHQFSNGAPISPSAIKTMTDFLIAYKEDMEDETPASPLPKQEAPVNGNHSAHTPSSGDRVEALKNTLLSLLNPRK